MKAIILAAGKGVRLQPLTKKTPKCLVELFGKNLLEWQIEAYKNHDINDITIVKGYKGEMINFPDITYFTNKKYKSTNMVETLFCAREKMNNSVIISYGDIIFEKKILSKLINSKHDISVVVDRNWKKLWDLRFDNPLKDAESLRIDENSGRILSIGQSIESFEEIEGQYIGLMKFQNEGLELIKNFYDEKKQQAKKGIYLIKPNITFEKLFMTDFLQALIDAGHNVFPISIEGGWLELDSINDYNLYKTLKKEKKIYGFFNPWSNN